MVDGSHPSSNRAERCSTSVMEWIFFLQFQVPGWLHHLLRSSASEVGCAPVSPQLAFITAAVLILMLGVYFVTLIADKMSREAPLIAKLGDLDKQMSNVKNESALIKKEAEDYLKNGGVAMQALPPPPTVTNVPPKELLEELESLKVERRK
jgi:hypothetical protein